MKNRGITLIELIISMALISIIIIFLFQLLVDAKYSDNKIDYARDDQQNRALIIKRVQDDFLDYGGLVALREPTIPPSDRLEIYLGFKNGSGKLLIKDDSLSYTNAKGKTETWKLKTKNAKYNINCVNFYLDGFSSDSVSPDFYSVLFSIPVEVKDDSQNKIDDLEFFYLGKKITERGGVKRENFPNRSYLGNKDTRKCKYNNM